jgi:hypothetical protein
MQTRNKPHTVESLLERTVPQGTCLVWAGASTRSGYGVAVYRGKQTTVHRVMYQLFHGAGIPEGMEVDHKCNTRNCINPDHLQLLTHQENMRVGAERRSACRAGHEWNDDNTYLAIVKRKQGGTREQRYCRICRAQHQADLRERRNDAMLKQLNPKRTA